MYKKGKYRVTNKLLLNLIYMYAHFIELITRLCSPDYVLENRLLYFVTLLYNQGYAIVTRRTSSCSFVLSLSPMSFILFIDSPYFFVFFFFSSPHPNSIFSSLFYPFSCCNKLKNKATVLVLVHTRYFNRTEKPLSRSYRMIVFVPPFSKILCTVCEISN